MIKWILLCVLFIPLLGAAGVRIHPEAFQKTAVQATKQLKRIELTSGESMAAEILSETESSLHINMDGAVLDLEKSEVKIITPVKPAMEFLWITWRAEDSLLPLLISKDKNAKDKKLSLPSASEASLFDPTSNIKTGLAVRDRVRRLRKDSDDRIHRIENQ